MIGLTIRLIIYSIVGFFFLFIYFFEGFIALGLGGILVVLWFFLLISVPISAIELRLALHKRQVDPHPVVYYELRNDPSPRDIDALDKAVCSDISWQRENRGQGDPLHFWKNISTEERIFMLIIPSHPPIIAFGHMGRQGTSSRKTKSVSDALVRAEYAVASFPTANRLPDDQITFELEGAQWREVENINRSENERRSQLNKIKQCPKCGRLVCNKPEVIECPFCLYQFGLNDNIGLQQQIRALPRLP